MTKLLHQQHIGSYLIERHVPWAFNHHLNISLPGTFCQFTKDDELFNLNGIGGIIDTPGTTGIAKTYRYIIFFKYIENFVIVLIKWVFISRLFHPGKEQRTTTGYNLS